MTRDIKIQINDKQKDILLGILKKQYPEYNKIVINHDNFIQMYKNYQPYQGWEDYGLNYDEYQQIYWFEFMLCELRLESMDFRNDYLDMILKENMHPIDALEKTKKLDKI